MVSRKIVIKCYSGLFNRQVTYFVQKANEFSSSIWLESGNWKLNAKSLIGMMCMELAQDARATILADGPDETEALDALEQLVQVDVP